MKIRELTNKAENLIEQGENAKQRQVHFQQQANSARAQVMSAYARLEAAASETDEEGNPTGDVSGARAEVYAAQALLESAEQGLAEANQQLEGIGRRKMDAVHEIERYEAVEEGNMSKLAELQRKRFGANANAFMADLAARMNSGEQARLQLLASMGIAASAKTFSGGSVSSVSAATGGASINEPTENADAKPILGGLFGRKKTEHPRRVITLNFNGFSLENSEMSGDKYFVKSTNYDKFSHFWQNSDQYSFADMKEIRTVNARDIEGIYLNENEALDSHLFWNRNQEYEIDSETYFMEVATHIPEVRMRLEAGESVESIRNNPKLKTCYDYYFDSPIEVYAVDDYYYFAHAGRHRCMAAQKLGYDIPVKVIGKYERKQNTVRLQEIKDFSGLSSYMNTKHGVLLDSSISKLELSTVKGAISGLESVVDEYPSVGDFLKRGITSDSGVMSCTGSELSFNPEYFKDKTRLADTCKDMSSKKFWIPNASPESIGVHEAAHGVEWALIQANTQYTSDYERINAWNNCTEAGKIVAEACDNVKKTPYGQGKSSTELVRSISAYAMKDDSETMAESFADVHANGENANPLSKEIKRLTKIFMNKYTGGQ